jgi:carnitine O-acetyltransferase
MSNVYRESKGELPSIKVRSTLEEPSLLKWTVDDAIQKSIQEAELRAESDIADLDSVLLHFNEWGSEGIKQRAKCSPDAFVQMVMQLAYYRTYLQPCPTYESASTRQFLHGRTECIRTCSVPSVAFTKAFDNEEINSETKAQLLKAAIDHHVQLTISSTNGQGVDRHLLGLRCMMTPEEAKSDVGAIFRDPAYMGSMTFELSSSNVSPGDYFYGGFGPVAPSKFWTYVSLSS